MNYWTKEKKQNGFNPAKKRTNLNQSLPSEKGLKSEKKIKKTLQYLLAFKKYKNVVDYTNLSLLSAFLNKYGKIRPRRKTRIPLQKQRLIGKAIRKSRALGLLSVTYDLNLKT